MKKALLSVFAAAGVLALVVQAQAQRKSPHESSSVTLGGATIEISYGRPYAKGRKIVGGLVPFDKVWRTGADEATVLKTPVDLEIGGLTVPKGEYAVFTVPSAGKWTLVVNKTAEQWGAYEYDAGQDLGRVEMTLKSLPEHVEQFTIDLVKSDEKSALIHMRWEKTEASVAFKTK